MARRKRLSAGRGYEFVKKGRGGATLRKKNDEGGGGVSFKCGCVSPFGGGGSCQVVIEPDGTSISCENAGCAGLCKWSIVIPGLTGRLSVVLEQ